MIAGFVQMGVRFILGIARTAGYCCCAFSTRRQVIVGLPRSNGSPGTSCRHDTCILHQSRSLHPLSLMYLHWYKWHLSRPMVLTLSRRKVPLTKWQLRFYSSWLQTNTKVIFPFQGLEDHSRAEWVLMLWVNVSGILAVAIGLSTKRNYLVGLIKDSASTQSVCLGQCLKSLSALWVM